MESIEGLADTSVVACIFRSRIKAASWSGLHVLMVVVLVIKVGALLLL